MGSPRVHFACDGTWYDDDGYEQVPACGYDFHGRKRLSDDPDEITCPTCRELLGIDVQLTECVGDPLLRRAA